MKKIINIYSGASGDTHWTAKQVEWEHYKAKKMGLERTLRRKHGGLFFFFFFSNQCKKQQKHIEVVIWEQDIWKHGEQQEQLYASLANTFFSVFYF